MIRLRKRLFAWVYHHLLSQQGHPNMDDPFTRERRAPLVEQATGDVLEIGAGDGGNLPFYPADARLTLLDPNPYMLAYLREACEDSPTNCIDVVEGVGERLPFPAACFDTVVMTHVLCSVSDQSKVVAEIKRVLRPGGVFLFLEHVAAELGTTRHRVQQVINPAWKAVGDGCHLTRNTGAAIRAAGFADVTIESFEADYPGIVSPHVTGSART